MEVVSFVRERLAAIADPDRAAKMQRYLRTSMPMFGVPAPAQKKILREAIAAFVPEDRDAWARNVAALWDEDEREMKYAAITYARGFARRFLDPEAVPLIERMVRDGAWWDLVDDIAANLLGLVVLHHREAMRPVLEDWITDESLWIRRGAVMCQVKHKEKTDVAMLLDFCRRCAHEKTYWMRKAIGCALRHLARTDPDVVRAFLDEMGDKLSGLTRREAAKHLS